MAINVSYQPSAAAVGGMANIAGQGEFYKWLYPQLVQQNQFATQLAHEDMTNAARAAFENQQAQQRQAAAMQMQQASLQQQAAIEQGRQNRIFQQQSMLDQQRDQRQAAMQGFLLDRDAQQQAAKMQYDLGHQALLLDRRTQQEQQQAALEDTKLWEQKFSNPFSDHSKAVSEAMKNGMTWGAGVQDEAAAAQKDIRRILEGVQNGQYNFADVKPQFKKQYARMMQAVPTEQAPNPQQEMQKRRVVLTDEATGRPITGFVDSRGDFQQIKPETEKAPQVDPVQKLKVDTMLNWQKSINDMSLKQWEKMYGAWTVDMGQPDGMGGMVKGPAPSFDMIRQEMLRNNPPPSLGDLGEFSGVGSIPQQGGQPIMPDGGQPANESVQSHPDPLQVIATEAEKISQVGNPLETPPQLEQQFSQSLMQLRQANPNKINDHVRTSFNALRGWEVKMGGALVEQLKAGNPQAEQHLTNLLTQIAAGRPFQQWSPEDQQEFVLFRSELDAYLRSQGRLKAN